jgi:hypothetical protein
VVQQDSTQRLKLWQMIPIAAILHGGLFWIPIQASKSAAEKPKTAPPSVKVSAMPIPKPSASPIPSPIAVKPIVQPSVKPSVQPVVQPQRTIIEPAPIVQPSAQPIVQPAIQPNPQVSPSPSPAASPTPSPTPPPKVLNTTADILSVLGQSCGPGCVQVVDKTLHDVIAEFGQQFGTAPEPIEDTSIDIVLGYKIVNREGKTEYLYYSSKPVMIAGKSGLAISLRQLPELITDRNRLVSMGIVPAYLEPTS